MTATNNPTPNKVSNTDISTDNNKKSKKHALPKRRFSYYENPPHTIGERIRWERHKRGLTQKQLSEKLNISPSYLGALERGSRPISAAISSRIHHFLNISYDYLLEGQGIPPSLFPDMIRETGPGSTYDELSHILKTCTPDELDACCSLVKTHLQSTRKQQFSLSREHYTRHASKNKSQQHNN